MRSVKLIIYRVIIIEVKFIFNNKLDLFFLSIGLVNCRSPPPVQFKNELNGGEKDEKAFEN